MCPKVMSRSHTPSHILWPWPIVAFVGGVPVVIFMPPLILVFMLVFLVGTIRFGLNSESGERALSWLVGLGALTIAYMLLALVEHA